MWDPIRVRAALRQVFCWLISTVRAFLMYLNLNVSSNSHNSHHHDSPEAQDQHALPQHQINIPTPVSHHSNHHAHEASKDVNPIMSLYQSKNLSKAVLNFAVPMAAGLLVNQYKHLTHLKAMLIPIALSLGFAATWNGMLLRGMYPRTASVLEISGVALVIVALYGLISSFLPPALVWTSWMCCALSCLPLALSLLPLRSAQTTHSNSNPPGLPV